MKVTDVMTENVFTVTRDMPLMLVAVRMLEFGISGMPVVEDGRVLGVVSETDILYKERAAPDRAKLADWLAHHPDDPPRAKLEARTAGEAMTTPAVTIAPGRSVSDASALMLDLGIDRLPVARSRGRRRRLRRQDRPAGALSVRQPFLCSCRPGSGWPAQRGRRQGDDVALAAAGHFADSSKSVRIAPDD